MLGERENIEKLTQTWEKIVIDRSEQTDAWMPIVRDMLAREQDVSMYFNQYEGHAPASIEKLKGDLEGDLRRNNSTWRIAYF